MEQYGSCPGSDGDAPITCRDNCPYMEIINEDDALKQAADRVTKDKESAIRSLHPMRLKMVMLSHYLYFSFLA